MIPDILSPLLQTAATSIAPDVEVDALKPCANLLHGDYQWEFALHAAKALRVNPRALAERLLPLLGHPAIAEKSVAGPGFINLKLSDAWLCEQTARMVREGALGGRVPFKLVLTTAISRTWAVVDRIHPKLQEPQREQIGTSIADALMRGAEILIRAEGMPNSAALRIGHPTERALLLAMMRVPEAMQLAERTEKPHMLLDHLHELARCFQAFYRACPVLAGGDARESRLALVDTAHRALWMGLETLELADPPPERIIIPRRKRRAPDPTQQLLLQIAARLGYTAPGDGLPGGSREAIAERLGVTPQAISEGWCKGWTPGTIARHREKAGIEAPVSGGAEISLPTV